MLTPRRLDYADADVLTDDGPYPDEIASILRADVRVDHQPATRWSPAYAWTSGRFGDLFEVPGSAHRVLVAFRGVWAAPVGPTVGWAVYDADGGLLDTGITRRVIEPGELAAALIAGNAVREAVDMAALTSTARDAVRAEEDL